MKITKKELIEYLYNLEPDTPELEEQITQMLTILFKRRRVSDNSIEQYLSSVFPDEIVGKMVSRVYGHYCEWCAERGYETQSNKAFSVEVNKKYGVKSAVGKINGKSVRVYK